MARAPRKLARLVARASCATAPWVAFAALAQPSNASALAKTGPSRSGAPPVAHSAKPGPEPSAGYLAGATQLPVIVVKGRAVASAMTYYRTGNYRVQLNVVNLTDRHYFPTASGDNQIMPGEPRSVILGVGVNF